MSIYANKIFYINNEPHKITKTAYRAIHYKPCKIDNTYENDKVLTKEKYYHFSNELDDGIEYKTSMTIFNDKKYQLYDSHDENIYLFRKFRCNDIYSAHPGTLTLLESEIKENYNESFFKNDSGKIGALDMIFDSVNYLLSIRNTLAQTHNMFMQEKQNKHIIYTFVHLVKLVTLDEVIKYLNITTIDIRSFIETIIYEYDEQNKIEDKIVDIIENLECPICLDVKNCELGHFKCKHFLCETCYELITIKKCMLCRSH